MLHCKHAGVVLLLLLIVAAWSDDAPLVLRGPAGASKGDIETCAKALVARCNEYGYTEVSAGVVEVADPNAKARKSWHVEVSSRLGINPKMRGAILALGATPCKRVALRFRRTLSEHESEQYEPGKSAPKGASWVAKLGDPNQVMLVMESPVIDLAGRLVWAERGFAGSPAFECSEAASKSIASQDVSNAVLVVDEMVVPCEYASQVFYNGNIKRAYVSSGAADDNFRSSVLHPMPCALTESKEGEEGK